MSVLIPVAVRPVWRVKLSAAIRILVWAVVRGTLKNREVAALEKCAWVNGKVPERRDQVDSKYDFDRNYLHASALPAIHGDTVRTRTVRHGNAAIKCSLMVASCAERQR